MRLGPAPAEDEEVEKTAIKLAGHDGALAKPQRDQSEFPAPIKKELSPVIGLAVLTRKSQGVKSVGKSHDTEDKKKTKATSEF
jgi:hypothetical protein